MEPHEYLVFDVEEKVIENIEMSSKMTFSGKGNELILFKVRRCQIFESKDNSKYDGGYTLSLDIGRDQWEVLKRIEDDLLLRTDNLIYNGYEIDKGLRKAIYNSPLERLGGMGEEKFILKAKMNCNETIVFDSNFIKIPWNEQVLEDDLRRKLYQSESFDCLIQLGMFWIFKQSMGMSMKIRQILC